MRCADPLHLERLVKLRGGHQHCVVEVLGEPEKSAGAGGVAGRAKDLEHRVFRHRRLPAIIALSLKLAGSAP
jgi:hypothetical protein